MRKRNKIIMVGDYGSTGKTAVVCRTYWPMRTVSRQYNNPTWASLARLDMLTHSRDKYKTSAIFFQNSVSVHIKKK